MKTKTELLSGAAASLVLEIPIEAPRGRVWDAMVEEIGSWWRPDFLVCEGSRGMRLDGGLGGRIYEETEGGGGLIWGSIISWQPPVQLMFVAQIVPPWGGPAQSVVRIDLEDAGAHTLLTLTDSLIGHVTEEQVSCLHEGWLQLFGPGGLKDQAEKGG